MKNSMIAGLALLIFVFILVLGIGHYVIHLAEHREILDWKSAAAKVIRDRGVDLAEEDVAKLKPADLAGPDLGTSRKYTQVYSAMDNALLVKTASWLTPDGREYIYLDREAVTLHTNDPIRVKYLANNLFKIQGVRSVAIANHDITVTKDKRVRWSSMTNGLVTTLHLNLP